MRDVFKFVLNAFDNSRILALEQGAVRIPSPTMEEGPVADYFADYMKNIGLEVKMFDVEDPFGSGKRSRQPVGWLRGSGDGPNLILNGHMDHNPLVGEWDRDPYSGDYEDGWVYGRGSQDDKGGIVSAISAAEALIKAGVRLNGDLLICPAAGHKSGGIGTRDLIKRGILRNYCINTENSGNGIVPYCVGVINGLIHVYASMVHFHCRPDLREQYFNVYEQISHFIQAMGQSKQPLKSDGWLSFTSFAELPGFPQLTYSSIDSHSTKEGLTKATLQFQIRTVPGITAKTVNADLEQLKKRLSQQYPLLKAEFVVPLPERYSESPVMVTERDSTLVKTLASAHELVTGKPPEIAARPRIGSVGDGNIIASHGIETVLYGPGTSEIFSQWPTPNEKIFLEDIVVNAKALALTAIDICGVKL